jgi:outer membrane lipoprotein SlyB
MNIENLPEIMKTCALSFVVTYGVMEALKPVIKMITTNWKKAAVRLAALVCGGCWGFFLGETAESTIAGVCGAALSSIIVARVKNAIKGTQNA